MKSQPLESLERRQRNWGWRFEGISKSILKEMGYTVIRNGSGLLSSPKETGEEQLSHEEWDEKLRETGSVLEMRVTGHAGELVDQFSIFVGDYLVTKDDQLHVVDVKSQGYVARPHTTGESAYTPKPIFFSPMQRKLYPNSKVPVLILLILYNLGRSHREKSRKKNRGRQGRIYSRKPGIRHLGPVYYKLVPFSEFKFEDRGYYATLTDKFSECKKLSSRDAYLLLRKVRWRSGRVNVRSSVSPSPVRLAAASAHS